MKIYMATWLQEINQKESLDSCKKLERLLSYYLIIDSKKSFKEYYENIFCR